MNHRKHNNTKEVTFRDLSATLMILGGAVEIGQLAGSTQERLIALGMATLNGMSESELYPIRAQVGEEMATLVSRINMLATELKLMLKPDPQPELQPKTRSDS